MYKHILIPTDGTALSEAALDKGLAFAREIGARVTVITTIEPAPMMVAAYVQLAQSQTRYHQHAAEQAARHLEAALAKAKAAGVPCETVQVEHDHPYEAIIETATSKGCDLIAMASHGRRGISALVLGSETTKVLTHSTTSVLVFR
ncbi:MAG: universal stress protein [Reyranella sp.]|uniref:universal stress protein n=1 Tax=Reyranella sp. TaxID=1929291 RepID=UPI00120F83EA|nr:universal stress protein [Reyranella sp.]TAJ38518.1 MAG: universal stress protein [Reyranella sp.]